MSDADLARKFHGLVDPVLGAARAAAWSTRWRRCRDAPTSGAFAALTRPSDRA